MPAHHPCEKVQNLPKPLVSVKATYLQASTYMSIIRLVLKNGGLVDLTMGVNNTTRALCRLF